MHLTIDYSALLKQLDFHKEDMKNKKVIFIGENGHGVSEIQSLKTQIIMYLYNNLEFSNIVFESGISEIAIANHYKDKLSPKELLTNSLYDVWHTKENMELFSLIKGCDISIYGIDLQYQNNYFNQYVYFLLKIYSEDLANEFSFAEGILNKLRLKISKRRDIKKVKKRLDLIYSQVYLSLINCQDEIMTMKNITKKTFDLILKGIESRLKLIELWLMNFKMYCYYRDKYMYEHLSYLINNTSGKYIVWAHNYHVRKNNSISDGWLNEKSLGEFYWEKKQDSYHLGIYMKEGIINNNQGKPYKIKNHGKNSLENELFKNTSSNFVFKSLDKTNNTGWINDVVIERESGIDKRKLIPSDQYDGIIGVNKVTPTKFLF
ncbi:erythromycin esterase family protein [Priestia filamentosa]|uniref:erythromycin esterase family protein n=1 Tax=Priestia filamentosa TaxID=1402861 RepID=UPI000E715842|nr:erythromycin esterase family protein [Priestia filamentosa]MDT3766263.1 erythromycin esterase family protein [Priestia filamentosa]RJS63078.1 hypothetical protein CJ485_23010 [Priestia filamentosa]